MKMNTKLILIAACSITAISCDDTHESSQNVNTEPVKKEIKEAKQGWFPVSFKENITLDEANVYRNDSDCGNLTIFIHKSPYSFYVQFVSQNNSYIARGAMVVKYGENKPIYRLIKSNSNYYRIDHPHAEYFVKYAKKSERLIVRLGDEDYLFSSSNLSEYKDVLDDNIGIRLPDTPIAEVKYRNGYLVINK